MLWIQYVGGTDQVVWALVPSASMVIKICCSPANVLSPHGHHAVLILQAIEISADSDVCKCTGVGHLQRIAYNYLADMYLLA